MPEYRNAGQEESMGESTGQADSRGRDNIDSDNVDSELPKEREKSVYEQRVDHINHLLDQIDKERVVMVSQLQPILGPKPGIDASNDKEGKPGDYCPSPLESRLNGTAKRAADLLTQIRVLQKRIVM